MITENYVSLEIAKLLSAKGFNGEFHKHYWGYKQGKEFLTEGSFNSEYDYPAPTHQMTMKWLREVHKLHCDIDPSEGNWKPNIIELDNWSCVDDGSISICNTYEEATEAAIKYCLEKKLIF